MQISGDSCLRFPQIYSNNWQQKHVCCRKLDIIFGDKNALKSQKIIYSIDFQHVNLKNERYLIWPANFEIGKGFKPRLENCNGGP